MERLLRLVRRGSENGNLQRGRNQKEIGACCDGFRFIGGCALAAPLHAAHYGRALVAAGVWERLHSVRPSAKKDRVGRRRSCKQAAPRFADIRDGAGWSKSAGRSESRIEQEDALH